MVLGVVGWWVVLGVLIVLGVVCWVLSMVLGMEMVLGVLDEWCSERVCWHCLCIVCPSQLYLSTPRGAKLCIQSNANKVVMNIAQKLGLAMEGADWRTTVAVNRMPFPGDRGKPTKVCTLAYLQHVPSMLLGKHDAHLRTKKQEDNLDGPLALVTAHVTYFAHDV